MPAAAAPIASNDDDLSPRFRSDTEDAASDPHRKLVAQRLKECDTRDNNVSLDRQIAEGRKANRGFTVSVSSRSANGEPKEEFAAPLRGDKRAQTMPAQSSKRGEYAMDTKALKKLEDLQKTVMARYRRGSVSLKTDDVNEEMLLNAWKTECKYHVHGLMTQGQQYMEDRQRIEYGTSPFSMGKDKPYEFFVACEKGSKGYKDTTPNQDNFSVTMFQNGWTLACAFDGHGPNGHHVSTRTVQTVPYFLIKNGGFGGKEDVPDGMIEDALIQAFETAQKDLVQYMLENNLDVQASGSTAVAALWRGNTIWTANCGDSRCAIGHYADAGKADSKVEKVFETEDHKPTTPKERERIEASGGEVRSQTYPDGWVNHRIFIKGEDYPGLCMARTFGDLSVKDCGVIATPEVAKTVVDLKNRPFLVISSDGVWEFLDTPFVLKAVGKKMKVEPKEKTVLKLQREARKRWKQEEGDYCDDVTSILVTLGGDW